MIGGFIAAGVFLAVGIALLIWGLTERSKRSKLALQLAEATHKNMDVERLLRQQQNLNGQLKMDKANMEEQLHALRRTIAATREQLKASNDPKTVENWLNAEMQEQP
jgi:hypothetical protein